MAQGRAGEGLTRILRALALCGGVVLLALMALVAFDIVMRRVLNQPFLGGFEMTELAMAVIVALGLPYCAALGAHVAVDLFAKWLNRPALRWIDVLVHLAGAALLAVVAWRTTLYAIGSYRFGDATNMMAIPKYPFQLVTAASAALFALVLLVQAVKAARGRAHIPPPAAGGLE
jgi:TRAP-type C4-dicarboxylate transport system permease small subunit